jgi:hypothetical protein
MLTANLSLALYDLFSILANILIFTGPNLSETYRHQVTKFICQGLKFNGYADCFASASERYPLKVLSSEMDPAEIRLI